MLQLVMGTDWISVRNDILNRIAADVATEQGNRIYMVPELISHDTERRLCTVAGDTASRFAEVLSFTRLANRVSDSVGQAGYDCLDAGGRIVAMAAAVQEVNSQLKVYAAVSTKADFLASMVEAIDEFKRCRISPKDLEKAAESFGGSFAQKLQELSLIMGAYDGICLRGKRDPRDREQQLLEQLEDGDFAKEHIFYIDGFPDFTRQHMAILEHLIRNSPSVTIGLNCDFAGSGQMAYEKAGETATELIRIARNAGVEYRTQRSIPRDHPVMDVCTALFQGSVPRIDDCLQVLRAETVMEEVTAAAEQVMELVRSGKYRYRDIGIVCGDMAAYQNGLDLVFHRCRIPLYRSGKEDILQKTVITTVLSAMDAALGGFEQRDVLRYLKSVLSPLDTDTGDKLENYAVLWGIRGKHWHENWKNHPDGLGELWTVEAEQRLEGLNEARQAAMQPLFRLWQGFEKAGNLGQRVVALYGFLEEIGLAQRLEELADQLEQENDNRSAQILNQLWEIVISALEQMYDVLGQLQWDSEHFTDLFKLLLSQYDVGTIPSVLDSVVAGPVSAMRCTQVKHLIVLGAAEGSLPGYGGSIGLLTDQERVALRNSGLPLTGGAMEGIQAEFAEIYGVFCGATETITVSCPGSQPSYVYRRLAQMAGGESAAQGKLGAALADEQDAAAYFAGLSDWENASRLGLQEQYHTARKMADFDIGSISRENVRKLYGSRLNLSASQIDRQAECRMSYFLKYGLRAKERKEATVDPAEFGTYVHWVLEKTARRVMELGGFWEVSLEQTMDIAMAYSEQYAAERFQDMDSIRIGYLFRRNRRELEMVVAELWQELKQTHFMPKEFELHFGDDGQMEAIDIPSPSLPAVLRGFVDRVDIWNEDGRNYFRVVDYKTGKKDFDYCDVFNGVGLQMLLYLFALEQNGYGSGAGVQYFPARVPLMSADGKLTEGEAQQLRMKEWKRKGLLLHDEAVLDAMDAEGWVRLCATRKKDGTVSGDLADREQLKMLRNYIFAYLGRMVDDIASGNVSANPYTRGTSHDACAFCPYGAICHKSTVEGRRNYKTMTAQRFWEEVEKEVNRRG